MPALPRGLRFPVLVESPRLVYPEQAVGERRRARVVLRVTVSVAGRATVVEVMESDGEVFEQAARGALMQSRFRPATRDGIPVAVTILQAFEFEPPTPPRTPEEKTTPPLDEAASPGSENARDWHARAGEDSAERATQTEAESVPEEPPEVLVRGTSDADRLRESARAVHVIETKQDHQRAGDLGEVLARNQGISVRRGAGLGSQTRLALNGLAGEQIRFFIDGVPLELSGYPFGVANLPVNLVDRVEVYRGVVPIQLGADALGGAVSLVTDADVYQTYVAGSYQAGSFGTQRVSLGGQSYDAPSGLFAKVNGFYDYADNDYPVDDVEVSDLSGKSQQVRAFRFNDAYEAKGLNAQVGLVDRPWADRLLLTGFLTEYHKELQSNFTMAVPYGEVNYGERTVGGNLRYQGPLTTDLELSAVAGYTHSALQVEDVAECIYSWLGECGSRLRPEPGEIETGTPLDQVFWENNAFARVNLDWYGGVGHRASLSVSPTVTQRTAQDRLLKEAGRRGPLDARRELRTLVVGAEHVGDFFGERLETNLFAKLYAQSQMTEEALPGGGFAERNRDTVRAGAGNALRFRFYEWLYAKTSYELATRLPRPDEVFGDGVQIGANLELNPELSHNANLSLALDAAENSVGALRGELNGFLRDTDNLIVLLGGNDRLRYDNVITARSVGLEASLGWTSPQQLIHLDGNGTYVDLRNRTPESTFGETGTLSKTRGDRIPNRPYLFVNGSARVQFFRVVAPQDELALVWDTRYVHQFFRSWPSLGQRDSKDVIPSQHLHGAALVYVLSRDNTRLSFTMEVQNITNARSYDFFGAQRPGRAFYFKTTGKF